MDNSNQKLFTKVKIADAKAELFWDDINIDYQLNSEGKRSEDEGHLKSRKGKIVHPDFQKAMDALKIHHVLQCEQIGSIDDQIVEEDIIDLDPCFHVGGVSITWKNDEIIGACIQGWKILESGLPLILNGPFINFKKESDYKHMTKFQVCVEDIIDEAELYLKGSKFQPTAQTKIDYEEGDTGDIPNDIAPEDIATLAEEINQQEQKDQKGKKKDKVVELAASS